MAESGRIMARGLLWIFAGVGLLAAAAVIFIAVTILAWNTHQVRDPAPIQGKAATEAFAVAEVNPLIGTGINEIVIATEASIGRGGGAYSSSGRSGEADERNVVLLDKATGANRKLLADNRRHIAARYYLPALAGPEEPTNDEYEVTGADGKQVKPPRAYYVLRVEAVDGKSEDILIGDLATGQQAFVLTGIDGVDRLWMQSPTRLGLLMRQGRKLYYRAIDIPTLKVVAAQPVDIG
ncbi:hypothetical protein IAG41_17285 [Sphingomonas sp. JC676]|uniref:hypothetical protein n=1 Tax=Sphingomonas sp. JC676 TaxID=2768065 RepID=UPI001657E542|nr:hypothetical protein [Sphingomonas sp. JC676]MBC9034145.1 hypothetical protein [Sphingomonas sp. JC676]